MKEKLSGSLSKSLEIDIPEEWQRILDHFSSLKRWSAIVIGGVDAGKSTLCNLLLSVSRKNTVLLEADPGQPSFSIPGTFSLVDGSGRTIGKYFIGEVTPHRNAVEVLNAVYLLSGRSAGRNLILDTSGFISGDFALQLKLAKANLAKVDHAILIEREEGELSKFEYHLRISGVTVLKCPSSHRARPYSPEERRKRRALLIKEYFKNACEKETTVQKHQLVIYGPGSPEISNNIISLENEKGLCITLGVLKTMREEGDRVHMRFLSPEEPKGFCRVKVGNIRYEEQSDWEKPY